MNPLVEEWVRKAEGDYGTAMREFAVEGEANYDAVCFHCQQCVEKYMKAFLIANGATFPKTHDLSILLDLCLPLRGNWADLRPGLDLLTRAAVSFRYPGEFAERAEAVAAKAVADRVRPILRDALGLP